MVGPVIAWFLQVKRHLLTLKGAVIALVFVVLDLVGTVVGLILDGIAPSRTMVKVSSVNTLAVPSHVGMLPRIAGRNLRMRQRGPVDLSLAPIKGIALRALRCSSKELC